MKINVLLYLVILVKVPFTIFSCQNNFEIIKKFQLNQTPNSCTLDQAIGNIYAAVKDIEVWDQNGNLLHTFKTTDYIDHMQACNDRIITANEQKNTIQIYDKYTGAQTARFGQGKIENLYGMKVDNNHNTIICTDLKNYSDPAMKVFDFAGNKLTEFPLSTQLDVPTFYYTVNQNTGDIVFDYYEINATEISKKVASQSSRLIANDSFNKQMKKFKTRVEMSDYVKKLFEMKNNRLAEGNTQPAVQNMSQPNITIAHKMGVYRQSGDPEFVFEIEPETDGYHALTTDAHNNILLAGSQNMYYYKPNGTLLKTLAGSTFYPPVLDEKSNMIFCLQDTSDSRTINLKATDMTTNEPIGSISLPDTTQHGFPLLFYDKETSRIITVLGDKVYVIKKTNN